MDAVKPSTMSPKSREQLARRKKVSFRAYEELHENQTSYSATLMNLFKGNVGTGCYAMADAMKNGGMILGPILTLIIAFICIHAQHVLIRCAEFMQIENELRKRPDYAETVELSFANSKDEKWRRMASVLKKLCNIFICVTQIGFCSVYFLFISENIKNVLEFYGVEIDLHILVGTILIPVWLSALIRELKYIAIFCAIANFCMIVGIILTVGFAAQNLPPLNERENVGSWSTLPLYFGTALFAFEGIALVLPLQNSMKNPKEFSKPIGVLNVGMTMVTAIYIIVGCVGYWQYGDHTEGSLTLNLPVDSMLGQIIKLMIAIGVMLGYGIQFFVAIQIMLPSISDKWKFALKHPVCSELIFRTFWVLVTFTIAQIVPNLSLLLSLIGSVCCVFLAFVFPVLAELVIMNNEETGIRFIIWFKNIVILLIAFSGFVFGGALSLKQIVEEIIDKLS